MSNKSKILYQLQKSSVTKPFGALPYTPLGTTIPKDPNTTIETFIDTTQDIKIQYDQLSDAAYDPLQDKLRCQTSGTIKTAGVERLQSKSLTGHYKRHPSAAPPNDARDATSLLSYVNNTMSLLGGPGKRSHKTGMLERAYKCALRDVVSECQDAQFNPQSIKLGQLAPRNKKTRLQRIEERLLKEHPPPSPRRPNEGAIEWIEPRPPRMMRATTQNNAANKAKKKQQYDDFDDFETYGYVPRAARRKKEKYMLTVDEFIKQYIEREND